ncbi:hypothetical protein GGI25_003036 [Coemansia spiralis]|uniref:Uncharacterized protein n=2 Tax=Coemansia TaxID=4863 RepID=A0A9W8G7K2_9FUNG|nr:hypothetical protein BX070DRAFT_255600 [Coemansia spiralis]KAJ1992138.1 hypothetical protein EDC05_002967 [Coemansia umbellata]KAJ2622042.1 hypothetical protein GGI26_003618 [Coemansia sp. RSA 1358]KAJ2677646.1 hypothetical protein GGI25_003036 [Coemansia spiralis]
MILRRMQHRWRSWMANRIRQTGADRHVHNRAREPPSVPSTEVIKVATKSGTKKEEQRLSELDSSSVEKSPGRRQINRSEPAQRVGQKKSAAALPATNQPAKRSRWTPEEDDALRTAVAMYGVGKWMLASRFVGSRTNIQCAIRWRYLDTPLSGTKLPSLYWATLLRRKSRLHAVLSNGGKHGSLHSVVDEILRQSHSAEPDKAASRSKLPGYTLIYPFSLKEDNLIARLVRVLGTKWTRIARLVSAANTRSSSKVPTRSSMAVRARFHQLVRNARARGTRGRKPNNRSGYNVWSAEEDKELIRVVKRLMKHGFVWGDVAQRISGRSAVQCAERWTHWVGTHLKHSPFTADEDKQLWPLATSAYLSLVGDRTVPGKAIRVGMLRADRGLGWMGAVVLPDRSPRMLLVRVRRLRQVLEWLRVVGGIEDPHLRFDVVHRLANTPAKFRIRSKTAA